MTAKERTNLMRAWDFLWSGALFLVSFGLMGTRYPTFTGGALFYFPLLALAGIGMAHALHPATHGGS